MFFCERVEELDDRWVVVMEYVRTRHCVTEANNCKGQVKAHLRKAVKELRELGLVRGDLRHVNVLITDEGAMLVDFDWEGKVEHATYPMNLNGDVEWPRGGYVEEATGVGGWMAVRRGASDILAVPLRMPVDAVVQVH
ncbi:uncharacterized protein STEHIDRAFT_160804 [Stereum hirsutum FP-91666 SS1]|uniref:uncharacterized protein n=1 Tax=Stereum hirsutum (strain FP-91666) TaxID=721885 RepID=UPI00044496E8|nr:uncharacterized protein STEHIDRAFT_160804 [Stereum hirsutum FP-91666 SS1]EIM82249.1 hypothetical protein STEHIDRAFT_160804 [Stereum hirsutum FP-91666 SS1]